MCQTLILFGLLFLLAACEPQRELVFSPSFTPTATLREMTAIPTIAIATDTAIPSNTPSPTEMASPTISSSPEVTTETLVVSNTLTADPIAIEAVSSPVYEQIEHYWLKRPIAIEEDNTHWLDRTYPYGGSAFGTREVHLGVEFVNPRFTPVLSAGTGTVYYAGTDENQRFGRAFDYYGNLVVIQHPFPSPDGLTVFTLYAHLQDIAVQTGDTVNEGQEIGRIGDSGIAVGPHLHFEVRVGDPTNFHDTRNPDMWLAPYPNSGTLIGRVSGIENLYGLVIFVRSETNQLETYTYGGDEVNSDPSWGENFTLGDLPEGNYEVLISDSNGRNYFRHSISIVPRVTSWIEIDLAGTGYEH